MHVFSAIGRLAELVCSWAVVPALSSTKSEGRRTPPQKKKNCSILPLMPHLPSSRPAWKINLFTSKLVLTKKTFHRDC